MFAGEAGKGEAKRRRLEAISIATSTEAGNSSVS